MSPGVPLLLGLVFCWDQGIWAQTDLPEVYQNPPEERSLPIVAGTSAIGVLPLLFLLLFFLCLCCCGGQHGIMRPRASWILTAPTLAWTSQKKIRTVSRCTSRQRRTGRRTCRCVSPAPPLGLAPHFASPRSTPRNARGALLSPPLSRTRIPSRRVRFHSRLAALRTPQYSPAWTRLHLVQRAELELAVCTPRRKGPLRSVQILLPLRDVGSPSPHFGAPRRLENTEALSVVKKFWDTRDGTFPAVSVNKGHHSHEQ